MAKHKRSIHVSPFEHDSRTLGVYKVNEELKSLIGIPIDLSRINSSINFNGVLACDSRKSFAFSKIQGKLLENLSDEISNTIYLLCSSNQNDKSSNCWHSFLNETLNFVSSLGTSSSEIIRIELRNVSKLESKLGTKHTCTLIDQLYRLIIQSLPPHFPFIKLATGDSIITSDNMMTAYIENKILAIAEHLKLLGSGLEVFFHKIPLKNKVSRASDLEKFFDSQVLKYQEQSGDNVYEFRMA